MNKTHKSKVLTTKTPHLIKTKAKTKAILMMKSNMETMMRMTNSKVLKMQQKMMGTKLSRKTKSFMINPTHKESPPPS